MVHLTFKMIVFWDILCLYLQRSYLQIRLHLQGIVCGALGLGHINLTHYSKVFWDPTNHTMRTPPPTLQVQSPVPCLIPHQFPWKNFMGAIFTEKGKYLQWRPMFIHYLVIILINNHKTLEKAVGLWNPGLPRTELYPMQGSCKAGPLLCIVMTPLSGKAGTWVIYLEAALLIFLVCS